MGKPVRVAMVIDHLGLGGAQRLLEVWLRYLDPSACAVTVYGVHGGGPFAESLRAMGVPVVCWPHCSWFGLPLTTLRFVTALRRGDYDILHLHLPGARLLWAATRHLLPRRLRVIIHEHSAPHCPDPMEHRARCLANSPDLVLTCSEAVREQLLSDYHVPPERIATLPNVVDVQAIEASGRAQTSDPFPQLPRPRVLAAGRLHELKGLDVLLAAWPEVVARKPAHLLIAGSGPLEGALRRQIAELAISDSVTLCGFRTDVPRLLAWSGLCVQPSRWEGFGLAAAEAMAAGLPVVATDIPEVREVVVDGVTGLRVPPDDPPALAEAITRLLGDPQLAARMGQAGHERVQQLYDAPRVVGQLADWYRQLANEACPPNGE
jgi:glycosyltransferase involved in cell wall biosynthesis